MSQHDPARPLRISGVGVPEGADQRRPLAPISLDVKRLPGDFRATVQRRMPRVLLCVPHSMSMSPKQFNWSFRKLQTWPGCEPCYLEGGGAPGPLRNAGGRRVLAEAYDAVLFIDADMTFPLDALRRLADHDKPIVSGYCLMRAEPFEPTTKSLTEDGNYRTVFPPATGLHQVDAVGGAFLYVQRQVLETVPFPWFEDYYTEAGHYRAEDITFCAKATKAGFEIWVDMDLKIGHIASAIIIANEAGRPTVLLPKGS